MYTTFCAVAVTEKSSIEHCEVALAAVTAAAVAKAGSSSIKGMDEEVSIEDGWWFS
jgi:hypothetical protein